MTMRVRRSMGWQILLMVFALTGSLLGVGAPLRAQQASQSITSHGLTVYFGFVPAAIAQSPARSHGETDLHGGPPTAGSTSYHLIVAIFNSITGDRIVDATATASVTRPGFEPPAKPLQPMKIADTVTYGNFFELPEPGVYRIRLSVTREGKARPAVIDLAYDHHIHGHRAQ
jgi:hypothetical protein